VNERGFGPRVPSLRVKLRALHIGTNKVRGPDGIDARRQKDAERDCWLAVEAGPTSSLILNLNTACARCSASWSQRAYLGRKSRRGVYRY
jgi:hypothetical protein